MDRVATEPRGLALLRREAPLHALMLVVMVGAMLVGTTAAMLAGSLVLVVVATGCAATARRSRHGAAHAGVQCLDLWAMALGMLALVHPDVPTGGHGIHPRVAMPEWVPYSLVTLGWLVARVTIAQNGSRRGAPVHTIPAMFTAVGLAVMPVLM